MGVVGSLAAVCRVTLRSGLSLVGGGEATADSSAGPEAWSASSSFFFNDCT